MRLLIRSIAPLLLWLMIPANRGHAFDPAARFEEGNRLYREARYEQAIEAYESILESGLESGSVYYNIGNCHYKLNRIGPAILYYERAARWMPNDPDLRANLELANLAVVDRIEPVRPFFLLRFSRRFIRLLSAEEWIGLTAVLYLIFMMFTILWIIARKSRARRLFSRFGAATAILCLLAGLALLARLRSDARSVAAVIMRPEVVVMSGPGEETMEIFTLHEGTRVSLDMRSGEWVEIILADGKVGWVRAEVLEEI